ncbi:MAG: SOS response-associated peptidase [Opitutae bacterium]
MCLRYSLRKLALVAFQEALSDRAAVLAAEWTPRYNATLSVRMPVITQQAGPALELMSFGLVAPARPPAQRPLLLGNARAETLLAKPSFRTATLTRRCLVLADGFYEWEKQGAARLPHYFTLQSGKPFFFAGLWEPASELGPAAFALVTTTPNELLRPIHDRMPVMLGPNSGPAWLGDSPLEPSLLTRLCRPLPAALMTRHRVDPKMNNSRYEAPDCVAPLPGQ